MHAQQLGAGHAQSLVEPCKLWVAPCEPPSAVTRLPIELLHLIFVLYGNAHHASATPSGPAPLTLSHVCRYWRTVTLDSPALWSVVNIAQPKGHELLQNVWLPRSHDADLCIHICAQEWESNSGSGQIEATKVMWALQPTVHRWKELKVRNCWHNTAASLIRMLCPQPGFTLPRLKKLSILPPSSWMGGHIDEPQLLSSSMPNINSIHICCCLLSFTTPAWSVNLKEIRLHFTTTLDSWSDIHFRPYMLYHILQQTSQNLETFSITIDTRMGKFPLRLTQLPAATIHLPKLTSLTLAKDVPGSPLLPCLYPLLRRIHAPLVAELSPIELSSLPVFAECDPLPGLQKLCLRDVPPNDSMAFLPYINNFFDSFTRLKALQAVHFSGISWIEGEYAVVLSRCCPVLTEVWLEDCSDVLCSHLRDLIQNRMPGNALGLMRIRCVVVLDCPGLEVDMDDENWFGSHVEMFKYRPSAENHQWNSNKTF